MPATLPNQMIVEGAEDQHAIIHLMKQHVEWGEQRHSWPVEIQVGKSVSEILEREHLSARLKQSGLQALGIVLDADESLRDRWVSVRGLLMEFMDELPATIPAGGLIGETREGVRLGVWLMPDNSSPGMLETFLRRLVPSVAQEVWIHAQEAVHSARAKGAPCRPVHDDKATIHTWLAWQDPPGERFGIAISKQMLDPHAEGARQFIDWFRAIYRLSPKAVPPSGSSSVSKRLLKRSGLGSRKRADTA